MNELFSIYSHITCMIDDFDRVDPLGRKMTRQSACGVFQIDSKDRPSKLDATPAGPSLLGSRDRR
jgi:hypothetical protein